MPYQLWSQDNFTKGELSPYMYARAQVNQYYEGMKQAQNVLCYPTGAAGKRFGTLYQATLSNIPIFTEFFFEIFQYLDQCIYQLVFSNFEINIYLEGIFVATVATPYDGQTTYNLQSTTIGSIFRVTSQGFKPMDLVRTALAPETITGTSGNQLVAAGASFTVGQVVPVFFTTTGTLPTTKPQILIGVVYFINQTSATTFKVYSSAFNAKFDISAFTITNAGTGTNSVFILNSWTFSPTFFKNLPVYDFTQNYDAIVFTPNQVAGFNTIITASAPVFTTAYIGGAFIGNGGTSRITAVTDSTHIVVATQIPFDNIDSIIGTLSFLAEPAWSDARGWPQVCSSYQNRALFANTVSLPNGFWASVINNYPDFGDLTTDDDDAISWFPTSNAVNVIRFIVPFRSITVHTNSGIYSSPLSEIAAITPNTFTLQLQDSTPADVLQPQAIDNQIIILSGNDAHTMIWDGINNAYTSNIVSIINEQTIRTPLDEATFADLKRAGSRYVFIINESGSMAMFQTLLAESVSGFTPQIMEQSYGGAFFRQVGSSSDGRCWFVVERQVANESAPIAVIDGGNTIIEAASATGFSETVPIAATFTTSTGLPTTTPQINTNTYYYVIAIDSVNFSVYLSQEDALNGINPIVFPSSVTAYTFNVVGWPLIGIFTLEELSLTVKLDCAIAYTGTPTDTVPTGTIFNAQQVKMLGDGFGFDAIGFNNEVVFTSHGDTVEVSNAFIGFPINMIIEPMPLSPPAGNQNTLTRPKHIRTANFMFNDTVGGTINGVPIAIKHFDQADIGDPPVPANGIFEMSIMQGWDDFNKPSFIIEHNEPFNIELLGVFYAVDT